MLFCWHHLLCYPNTTNAVNYRPQFSPNWPMESAELDAQTYSSVHSVNTQLLDYSHSVHPWVCITLHLTHALYILHLRTFAGDSVNCPICLLSISLMSGINLVKTTSHRYMPLLIIFAHTIILLPFDQIIMVLWYIHHRWWINFLFDHTQYNMKSRVFPT